MNGLDELFGRASLSTSARVVELVEAQQPVEVPQPPPEPEEAQNESSGKGTCTKCARALQMDVVYRPCGHSYHTQCLLDLVTANRRWCSKCPAPSAPRAAHTGYALDAGNDPCARSAIMATLEHQRQKVRIKLGAFSFAFSLLFVTTTAYIRTQFLVFFPLFFFLQKNMF